MVKDLNGFRLFIRHAPEARERILKICGYPLSAKEMDSLVAFMFALTEDDLLDYRRRQALEKKRMKAAEIRAECDLAIASCSLVIFDRYYSDLDLRVRQRGAHAFTEEEIVYTLTEWKIDLDYVFVLRNGIHYFVPESGQFRMLIIENHILADACK